MWKTQAGVAPEALTETAAAALNSRNYNYFAGYNNNSAITVNGFVASGSFIDTVWNVAWLKGAVQTNMFNILLSNSKVAQTDSGMQTLAAGAAAAVPAGCYERDAGAPASGTPADRPARRGSIRFEGILHLCAAAEQPGAGRSPAPQIGPFPDRGETCRRRQLGVDHHRRKSLTPKP